MSRINFENEIGTDNFAVPIWFFRFLIAIPGIAAGYHKFVKYCEQQVSERMSTRPEVSDIMTPILEPFQNRKPKGLELSYLHADSRLAIVAGRSDIYSPFLECTLTDHLATRHRRR